MASAAEAAGVPPPVTAEGIGRPLLLNAHVRDFLATFPKRDWPKAIEVSPCCGLRRASHVPHRIKGLTGRPCLNVLPVCDAVWHPVALLHVHSGLHRHARGPGERDGRGQARPGFLVTTQEAPQATHRAADGRMVPTALRMQMKV